MNAIAVLLRLILFVCLLGSSALPPADYGGDDGDGPSLSDHLERFEAVGANGEPQATPGLTGSFELFHPPTAPDGGQPALAFEHQRSHFAVAILAYAPGRSPPSLT